MTPRHAIRVHGRVQGISFRAAAGEAEARCFGLAGVTVGQSSGRLLAV